METLKVAVAVKVGAGEKDAEEVTESDAKGDAKGGGGAHKEEVIRD